MAKSLVVDFKGVESGGGGGARVPEDDYRVKVSKVEVGESKSSGNTMLIWTFEITKGNHKGKKLKRDYTTLTKESLWKLKALLEAMGLSIPPKKLDLAPLLKKVQDKELGVSVIDEEYENKMQSKISDYIDLETLEGGDDDDDSEDSDDEDEAPKKKKKKSKDSKKGKKKKSDDDDDIEDLDLDEL